MQQNTVKMESKSIMHSQSSHAWYPTTCLQAKIEILASFVHLSYMYMNDRNTKITLPYSYSINKQ